MLSGSRASGRQAGRRQATPPLVQGSRGRTVPAPIGASGHGSNNVRQAFPARSCCTKQPLNTAGQCVHPGQERLARPAGGAPRIEHASEHQRERVAQHQHRLTHNNGSQCINTIACMACKRVVSSLMPCVRTTKWGPRGGCSTHLSRASPAHTDCSRSAARAGPLHSNVR